MARVSVDIFDRFGRSCPDLKERALEKIKLLAENPAHPSLNAHKIKEQREWECYINMAYRIIYEPLQMLLPLENRRPFNG